MKEDLHKLAVLIAAVQIRDLRLVESACSSPVKRFDGDVNLRINWSAKSIRRNETEFSVLADLEVQLLPGGASETEGARVFARYEIEYAHPGEVTFADDLLDEFARLNGVFNAWPYWREFVQNALGRMGLPPIPLPLYRVTPPPQADSSSAKKAAPARKHVRRGAKVAR